MPKVPIKTKKLIFCRGCGSTVNIKDTKDIMPKNARKFKKYCKKCFKEIMS